MGECPSEESRLRLQPRHCNQQACPASNLTCAAKTDAVILLDTSGSLAAEPGNNALRDLAEALSTRFLSESAHGARVAAVSFTDEVQVLSALTNNSKSLHMALAAGLENVLAGPSHMAPGLVSAKTLFQRGGRPDARWTVILLTDGIFADPLGSQQAAAALLGIGGRLVAVSFASGDKRRIGEELGIPSSRQSVIEVEPAWTQTDALDVEVSANEIIRAACSEVA